MILRRIILAAVFIEAFFCLSDESTIHNCIGLTEGIERLAKKAKMLIRKLFSFSLP